MTVRGRRCSEGGQRIPPASVPEARVIALVEVLQKSAALFKQKGIDSPRLDAELIVGDVLGLDRVALYLQHDRPLGESEVDRIRELVRRRARREPLAYVLGHREFWSLDLVVRPGVLVPRPDTETLVEAALALVPEGERFYVADVGTGSGAVALAIAKERPEVRVFATDLSDEALRVAKENATRLDLADRVAVLKGAFLDPIPTDRPIDLVVSNPPYVPSADIAALMPDVRDHEPRLALDGGPDGLDVIRALITAASARARRAVALEVGQGQAPAVADLLSNAGFRDVAMYKDLAGIDRVVTGRR
jgi:release factor glutamine methyltransferase